MKTHTRRIIAVGMVFALALSMITCSLGEQTTWDCPECGRIGNTGNFCGGCAHSAPWIESEPVAELTAEPDVILTAESLPVGQMINIYGITNAKVNFRSGPATDSAGKGSLSSGKHVYIIMNEVGNADSIWSRVNVDGQEGYLKSEFINVMSLDDSNTYNQAQSSPAPVYMAIPTPTAEPTEKPTPEPTPTLVPTATPIPSITLKEFSKQADLLVAEASTWDKNNVPKSLDTFPFLPFFLLDFYRNIKKNLPTIDRQDEGYEINEPFRIDHTYSYIATPDDSSSWGTGSYRTAKTNGGFSISQKSISSYHFDLPENISVKDITRFEVYIDWHGMYQKKWEVRLRIECRLDNGKINEVYLDLVALSESGGYIRWAPGYYGHDGTDHSGEILIQTRNKEVIYNIENNQILKFNGKNF